MPELPEVEAMAAFLRTEAVGRAVTRIHVVAINSLKTFRPPIDALVGRTVTSVQRHGKFLDLGFEAPDDGPGTPDEGPGAPDGGRGASDDGTDEPAAPGGGAGELHLVIHLARAGWLRWSTGLSTRPPKPGKGPLAIRVHLGDRAASGQTDAAAQGAGAQGAAAQGAAAQGAAAQGAGAAPELTGTGFDLTEAGTQKRLAVHLVADPLEVPGIRRLGPDPLRPAFTPEVLHGILREAGAKQIKGVLTDQARIAGIGNAYSDEILHAARLSPFKPAHGLSAREVDALYAAISEIERDAVRRSEGLAASDLKKEKKSGMAVHGRTGEACPTCGDTVREVSFADKSFQYCPACQTGGKILADRRLSRLLK